MDILLLGRVQIGTSIRHRNWCPGPELNRHEPFGSRDFKSRASASFATRAYPGKQMLSRCVTAIPLTWQCCQARKVRPMRGRTQALFAIVIAYAVMVILISPAVPSPQSTDPSKQTVVSPQVVIWFTALLFSTAGAYVSLLRGKVLASTLHLAGSGSELVERTTARRC
jgi:hypothetical protein